VADLAFLWRVAAAGNRHKTGGGNRR
jgi:hypothetical protein